jgi:hypothetical protein
MGIISRAFSLITDSLWRRFEKATADPDDAQMRVLRDLLARAANTQWGRKVGIADIRTADHFRKNIPLTPYQAAAPLWHRAFEGDRDVAWPGHVDFFASSSGTTAGEKLIPVTRDAIRSNLRAGALLTAILARRGSPANLVWGKFLYLGGSTTLRRRGQSLFGDASGIMGRRIPFYVRGRHLPAPDIAAIADWQEKINRIVGRYLAADVRMMGACPSWTALLFKQMLQEASSRGMGCGTIGQIWPRLSHFVSYGMAMEPYRAAFDQYVGRPIHYVDTYSSSEAGMTAIQEEAGGPLRMIVDNGVYFEFIPAGRDDEAPGPNSPRLNITEVQEGRDYAMVVSTNGGIWAYPLGDVIRFESLRPPRIVFAGRTQIMLNAFGEHVTLEMIENAMSAACRQTSATIADYTIAPRFPSPQHPQPAHQWIVEFDRPPAPSGAEGPASQHAFIAAIDSTIRKCSEDYDTHRTGDYGLAPPILTAVAPGTFYTWMKQKGKLGGQHKVPRVARSQEMVDELLAISKATRAS